MQGKRVQEQGQMQRQGDKSVSRQTESHSIHAKSLKYPENEGIPQMFCMKP